MRYRDYIIKNEADVLKSFNSNPKGLTEAEAANRLNAFGLNQVVYQKPRLWIIFLNQAKSFFVLLLAVAAGINIAVLDYKNAAIIFFFTLIYIFAGFYQEAKAENTIFKLRRLVEHKVRVRRDGKIVAKDISFLVPGDIIILRAGDFIPADVRFIKTNGFLVDESSLTGESIPVAKRSGPMILNVAEDLAAFNLGFLGSTAVGGSAEAIVVSTGRKTYFSHIFEKISGVERPSLFEKNINKIGKFLTILVIILVVIASIIKYFLTGEFNIQFLTFLIALIVSVVPEALPVVVTLALSKGAFGLAKLKVLVRRLTAIEDIGSIEVLCTDKTGTITQNHLTVASFTGSKESEILTYALLSAYSNNNHQFQNPFDRAIDERATSEIKKIFNETKFLGATPFDPIHKINTVSFENKNGEKITLSRGAVENILEQSNYYLEKNKPEKIDNVYKENILNWFKEEGLKGHRVLAISKTEDKKTIFVGCISFEDPLKESSAEALKIARELGIDLKIITGDAREVAGAVGFSLGLVKSPNDVITGALFEKLSELEKSEAVNNYNIFARTSPLHKLMIIEALQKSRSVGFLGEGMNDVPALKVANLSMVVAEAEDMARSVSDIILLKDDLLTIIEGVREGRRVFINIFKYIKTTLAANIGNFMSLVLFSLLFPFLPMLPVQVLLVNLLSDTPMISIFMDRVSDKEIKKPQKYELKSLFIFVLIFGLISFIFDFAYFNLFLKYGERTLQTGWFAFSIISELITFFSLRSLLPILKAGFTARSISWISIGVITATIFLIFNPKTIEIFNFANLNYLHLLLIFAVALGYLIINELVKSFYRRKFS